MASRESPPGHWFRLIPNAGGKRRSLEGIALPNLYLLTITLGTVQWSRGEWHRSSFKGFAYFKSKVG
jgi:hypothetical protein